MHHWTLQGTERIVPTCSSNGSVTYRASNSKSSDISLVVSATACSTACPTACPTAIDRSNALFHWHAYINTLPKQEDFQHLPSNWTSDRIDRFGPLVAKMLHSFVDRFEQEILSMHTELVDVVVHLTTHYPFLFSSNCNWLSSFNFLLLIANCFNCNCCKYWLYFFHVFNARV